MNKPKILAFAGSARKESLNKKLIRIAAEGAQENGADVSLVDLRDYPMPLYDGDLEAEQGLPENAKKFKKLMLEHQGLLISCPEYNSSITPLLKNTLDWCSRTESKEEAALACFKGKTAVLMAASPGALGGLRGLIHVRAILSNIAVLVLPDQMAVPKAHEAFLKSGELKDPKQQGMIKGLGAKLTATLIKLQ